MISWSNSLNLLRISTVQLLYTVKEKGEKPDGKPYPLSYGLRNPYRNLKSENSQDYAQKPQRKCTSMNSASGVCTFCISSIYLKSARMNHAEIPGRQKSFQIRRVCTVYICTPRQNLNLIMKDGGRGDLNNFCIFEIYRNLKLLQKTFCGFSISRRYNYSILWEAVTRNSIYLKSKSIGSEDEHNTTITQENATFIRCI